MRILYFASVDFYAKPNPSFHLMLSMITDLLDTGFQIEFIGCAQEGVEKHIPDELATNPDFHYKLLTIPNTPKNNFARRYFDGIDYARKAKKVVKTIINTCDCIFIQSSPTVLYNINVIRELDKRKPILYNVQDMFPGSSIASGVMPKKWMQKVFYRLQKNAYRKSDVMVAISEDMKTKLMEQGVSEDRIRVIVNWFDDTSVHEVNWEENTFAKEYHLSKEFFYVQYAGTMGYVFDYKMVLEVAELLKPYEDIVIQMIGEGSQKNDFIMAARDRGLDNIQFLPLQPQQRVSEVYSACSVCFIPLKKGIIGNSVPSKAGLLMACKRPIVTSVDAGSEYANMINGNRIGYAINNDDPKGVANAILKLKSNPQEVMLMGNLGYQFGHSLFSRSNNMKKYITLFNEMCQKK